MGWSVPWITPCEKMVFRHSISIWAFIFEAPGLFLAAIISLRMGSLLFLDCSYGFGKLYFSIEVLVFIKFVFFSIFSSIDWQDSPRCRNLLYWENSSMMSPSFLEEIVLTSGYNPDSFYHKILQVVGTAQSQNTFSVQ